MNKEKGNKNKQSLKPQPNEVISSTKDNFLNQTFFQSIDFTYK